MAKGNQFWLERSNLQHPATDVVEGETVTEEQIVIAQTNQMVQNGQVMDRKIEARRIISFDSPGEIVVSIQEAPINDLKTAVKALDYGDKAGHPAIWVTEALAHQNHKVEEIGRFQARELEAKIAALVPLDSAKMAKTEDVFWSEIGEDENKLKKDEDYWIIIRSVYSAKDGNPALNEAPSQKSALLQSTQPIERVPNPVNEGPVSSKSFSGEQIIIVRAQKQLSVEDKKLDPAPAISNSAQPLNFGPKPESAAAPVSVAGGNPFFATDASKISFAPGALDPNKN